MVEGLLRDLADEIDRKDAMLMQACAGNTALEQRLGESLAENARLKKQIEDMWAMMKVKDALLGDIETAFAIPPPAEGCDCSECNLKRRIRAALPGEG